MNLNLQCTEHKRTRSTLGPKQLPCDMCVIAFAYQDRSRKRTEGNVEEGD